MFKRKVFLSAFLVGISLFNKVEAQNVPLPEIQGVWHNTEGDWNLPEMFEIMRQRCGQMLQQISIRPDQINIRMSACRDNLCQHVVDSEMAFRNIPMQSQMTDLRPYFMKLPLCSPDFPQNGQRIFFQQGVNMAPPLREILQLDERHILVYWNDSYFVLVKD